MKKVFITSTLKSQWNKEFNPRLCSELEAKGFVCHLPQRDTDQEDTSINKCKQNLSAIDKADVVLGVSENETINWGLEIGYAFGCNKQVILLASGHHEIPVMATGMYYKVVRVDDLGNIKSYIDELISVIK